jgi:hypothetical protein
MHSDFPRSPDQPPPTPPVPLLPGSGQGLAQHALNPPALGTPHHEDMPPSAITRPSPGESANNPLHPPLPGLTGSHRGTTQPRILTRLPTYSMPTSNVPPSATPAAIPHSGRPAPPIMPRAAGTPEPAQPSGQDEKPEAGVAQTGHQELPLPPAPQSPALSVPREAAQPQPEQAPLGTVRHSRAEVADRVGNVARVVEPAKEGAADVPPPPADAPGIVGLC